MIYLTRNVGTAIETLNNLLRFANSRARSSKTSSLFHPMCYRWKIKHSKPVWRHTACWHVLCWGGDSSYRYYRSYVTSPPYTPDENYFGPPEELVILCSNFSSSLLSSRNGCPVQSSSWTMISPYLQRPMLRTIWADIMISWLGSWLATWYYKGEFVMSECERDAIKTGKLHSQSMQSEMDSRLLILSYSSVASRCLHFAWIANKALHLSLPNIYTPSGFM